MVYNFYAFDLAADLIVLVMTIGPGDVEVMSLFMVEFQDHFS